MSYDNFKSRVCLNLYDLDLEKIYLSEVLGVSPSRSWMKGEAVSPQSEIRQNSSGVSYEFEIVNDSVESTIIENIFPLISNIESSVLEIKQIKLELAIVIYTDEDQIIPSISFSNDTLGKLFLSKLQIDIDII
jgi:hypothetical protein